MFKPLAAGELERYVDASMKVPARVWNDVLTQLLTVDLRRDLRGIKARTLILWGDKDGVSTRADQADAVPGDSERDAEGLRGRSATPCTGKRPIASPPTSRPSFAAIRCRAARH